jgi:hypothetical protein
LRAKFLVVGIACAYLASANRADAPGASVDVILSAYVAALGGQAAIDKITTRQLEVSPHRAAHLKMYWMAPNKVLSEGHRERQGFDGSDGWYETKRKRVQKLPHSRQDEMETDANPIRFAHLRDLYNQLEPAPPVTLDSTAMDVIAAPNDLGATKFYFDRQTHLLSRMEEFGVTSAYFKHTTEFLDYQEIDGIKFPRHIVRESQEPGSEGDLKLSSVKQNIPLDEAMFHRPEVGKVVSGGKH